MDSDIFSKKSEDEKMLTHKTNDENSREEKS